MNTELAKLILKQAEEFPGTFTMSAWARETPCGTAACIAGWAMIFSGYSFRREAWKTTMGISYRTVFTRPDGTELDGGLSEEGIALLGLSAEEYHHRSDQPSLFYMTDEQALARLRELTEAHS